MSSKFEQSTNRGGPIGDNSRPLVEPLEAEINLHYENKLRSIYFEATESEEGVVKDD